MTNDIKVLVAGATGYIGGCVTTALRNRGFWVRGLTRNPDRLKVPQDVDDAFVGHATQAETLHGLCDGIDVVFSSIGIHSFGRKPTLWEVDYQANMNILREAQRAGVRHFIFITVLHAPQMAHFSPIAAAREKVAQAIIASGMDYTIYQPTGYFNDMAYLFQPIAKNGIARLYGDPDVLINPMHGLDFGEEVARAIDDPTAKNTIRPVGGPEVYTRREMAELAFYTLVHPPKIQVLPAWLLTLAAYAIRPFNYNLFALLRFLEFSFRTPDMTGQPIGHRSLKSFFEELAQKEHER